LLSPYAFPASFTFLSPYAFPASFTFLSPVLLNSLRFLMNPGAGLGLAVPLRLAGSPLG
jgi:hypothetical protein